jgi:hypothetical protein
MTSSLMRLRRWRGILAGAWLVLATSPAVADVEAVSVSAASEQTVLTLDQAIDRVVAVHPDLAIFRYTRRANMKAKFDHRPARAGFVAYRSWPMAGKAVSMRRCAKPSPPSM